MKEKKLNYSEAIASILLFSVGLFHMIRGVFWIVSESDTKHDSLMYQQLDLIMPLYVWGVVLSLGALFFLLASITLPRHHISKSFSLFLLMGGIVCGIVYFAVAVVGFSYAINWLTPAQLVVLSTSSVMLGFYGGAVLWSKKSL